MRSYLLVDCDKVRNYSSVAMWWTSTCQSYPTCFLKLFRDFVFCLVVECWDHCINEISSICLICILAPKCATWSKSSGSQSEYRHKSLAIKVAIEFVTHFTLSEWFEVLTSLVRRSSGWQQLQPVVFFIFSHVCLFSEIYLLLRSVNIISSVNV